MVPFLEVFLAFLISKDCHWTTTTWMALFLLISGKILISVEIEVLYCKTFKSSLLIIFFQNKVIDSLILYWIFTGISRTMLSPIYQLLFHPLTMLPSCYMETLYAQFKTNRIFLSIVNQRQLLHMEVPQVTVHFVDHVLLTYLMKECQCHQYRAHVPFHFMWITGLRVLGFRILFPMRSYFSSTYHLGFHCCRTN
jgi:hypothetical protein